MNIGLILVGSGIGALSALVTLVLGQSPWVALPIYSAAGVASVSIGAMMLAKRPKFETGANPRQTPSGPQRS